MITVELELAIATFCLGVCAAGLACLTIYLLRS